MVRLADRAVRRRGFMAEQPAFRMMGGVSLFRRIVNFAAMASAGVAALLVLVPLFLILGFLVTKGIGSVNWAFLTQTPKPVGEAGGGMANATIIERLG